MLLTLGASQQQTCINMSKLVISHWSVILMRNRRSVLKLVNLRCHLADKFLAVLWKFLHCSSPPTAWLPVEKTPPPFLYCSFFLFFLNILLALSPPQSCFRFVPPTGYSLIRCSNTFSSIPPSLLLQISPPSFSHYLQQGRTRVEFCFKGLFTHLLHDMI